MLQFLNSTFGGCLGAIKCIEYYGAQTLKATGAKTVLDFLIIRTNL